MADGDRDEAEQQAQPSLELPKLGWRRKRRTASADSPAPPSPPAAPAAATPAPAAAPEPAAAEPGRSEPTVAREPSRSPAEEPIRRERVLERPDAEPARTVPQPAREGSVEADGRAVGPPAGAPLAGLSGHSPGHPAGHSPEPAPGQAAERATLTSVDTTPEPDGAPARARRVPRLHRPGGMAAAVLTGMVVGLGIVGLTWAALRLWESVRGSSVAGNTGYPLLVAIIVIMVVVGALLLRAARVPEASSTSFLGVGLTAVIALLFLVDSLLDRSMVVVIPVITAATFAGSHWVTRTFVEPGDRPR